MTTRAEIFPAHNVLWRRVSDVRRGWERSHMWKTPGGCVVIEPDARGRPREDSASSRAPEGTLLPDHRATDRYWSICLFRHLVDCNYQRVVQRLGWSLECRFSSGSHPPGNKSTTSHFALTIQKFSTKTVHLAPTLHLQLVNWSIGELHWILSNTGHLVLEIWYRSVVIQGRQSILASGHPTALVSWVHCAVVLCACTYFTDQGCLWNILPWNSLIDSNQCSTSKFSCAAMTNIEVIFS